MNRQTSKESATSPTKKESNDTPTSPVSASDSDGGGYGNDTVSRPSNFSSYADYTSRDVSEEIDEEDDPPPLSERVTTYHDDDVSARFLIAYSFDSLSLPQENLRKVQFNKNGSKQERPPAVDEDDEEKRRRKE